MDAAVAKDERSPRGRRSRVVLGAPKQALKSAVMLRITAGDGGNQAMVTGESAYKS
jgi:hypothetical protein